MNYSKEIGARLKEARKKCGLTQEAIASKFEIDKSSISKYENGVSSPDIEFLRDFAEYLKLNGDWLLFGKPPIFMASGLNQDIEGLFLELLAAMKGTDTESPPLDCLPAELKDSLEGLTEESPENFILLLDYMITYPTARQDIFKYFHLFVKPTIDGGLEVTE